MRYALLPLLLTACIYDSAVWVSLSGEGSGVVTSNPAGISCGGDDQTCAMLVAPGSPVELIATPTSAFDRFTGWSGDCTGEGTCMLNADGDVRVDAQFALVQHTLTVELAGSGRRSVASVPGGIACDDSGGDCTHQYAPGTQITLTAHDETVDVAFAGWSGVDGCTTDPVCTFTIDRDVTARATFEAAQQIIVNLYGSGMGRVVAPGIDCPGDCAEYYPIGSNVTLETIAAAGSAFSRWTDGNLSAVRTVTIPTMTLGLGAEFRLQPALTVTKQGNGSGTVTSAPAGIACGATCTMIVPPSTQVVLTATAASGSVFAGWSGPCTGTATCAVTVQNSTNVTALFTAPPTGYGTPASIAVGANPTEVEAVDLNLDGKLDLVVANDQGPSIGVLVGNGDGTFLQQVTYPLAGNPRGIALGRINTDTKPDILVALSSGNVVPMLSSLPASNTNFMFGPAFSLGAVVPEAIALGDLDGDGRLDAAVTEQTNNTVRILLGSTAAGYFNAGNTYTVGTLPTGVAIADFNNDGKRDIVTANYSGGTLSVLLNNGNASFAAPASYGTTQTIAFSVSAGDLDGDGNQDLAVANFTAPTQSNVSILRGNGNGTFQTAVGYGVGSGAWAVTIADLDLDGKQDVLAPCSYSNDVWRLRGNGSTLSPAKLLDGSAPHDVAVGDFNGDGWPDLAIANGASNSIAIVLAQ